MKQAAIHPFTISFIIDVALKGILTNSHVMNLMAKEVGRYKKKIMFSAQSISKGFFVAEFFKGIIY